MTIIRTLSSARAELSGGRTRRIVAGLFALTTMLFPVGAWSIDSTPRLALDRAGNRLRLPPIPYLESTGWMGWKPIAPLFKIDTLLLPDNVQPGLLQIPREQERSLPKMS